MNKPMSYLERLRLEVYLAEGYSKPQIARKLNRSVRTIFYELKRGRYDRLDGRTYQMRPSYSADIAQRAVIWNASSRGRPVKLDRNYRFAAVLSVLICEHGRSPYHVADYCKRHGIADISPSTIYRYIDAGFIPGVTNFDLPRGNRPKRKYRAMRRHSRPPFGMSIEERPDISDRSAFGHWEMDTVIGKAKGKGEAALVLTERKTRYQLIYRLPARDVRSVNRALGAALRKMGDSVPFLSITVDNGSEFSGLPFQFPDVSFYYCHPYSSYERGSNERNNREIRRQLPKGTSLRNVTQKRLDEVAHWLNTMYRPRSICTTAEDAFCAELQIWQDSKKTMQ